MQLTASPSPAKYIYKFIIRLGAGYIHILLHILKRVFRPLSELFKKPPRRPEHKKETKTKKETVSPAQTIPSKIFNTAFPVLCTAVLIGSVRYVRMQDYGVAVEIDGKDMGMITGDDVYGEAQRLFAERLDNYSSDGSYTATARLTVRPVTSRDNIIDHRILADKMEEQIPEQYSETSAAVTEETAEVPDFEDFITNSDDPDLIQAVMVKADKRVLGFVSSYDRIEEFLEDMKSVCYSLEGITPEDVFFDKTISFEPYEINKMAVVDQERIIDILAADDKAPVNYEIVPGDYLISIAEKVGMSLEELTECRATLNGKEVTLGDNLQVGTIIEIQNYEPFLTVEYKRENQYEKEIDFSTVTVNDDTVPIGQTEVEREGSAGLEKITASVTYAVKKDENGKLTASAVRRKITARETIKPPVSEVIKKGTKLPDPSWGKSPGSGEYFWPVDGGYISSPFGGERNHKGLDIAAPLGTPIYAAAAGTVIKVGSGWSGGYGNHVVIENDDGNITYYAHQSETACEVGEHVEAGQVIGYVGSTGDSTGYHLHFEVRCDGYLLDPQEFVSQD